LPALVLGLVVFLGVHSIRIVADDWRSARIATGGERPWKGLFALASLVGFALIVWGYGLARENPVVLWSAPTWARHAAALLVLLGFILIAATYVPRNHFKAALGHPMYAGTKLWAFGHLLANGTLADLLLFGSFLVWAVAGFRSGRVRDRRAGLSYPAGTGRKTIETVVIGTLVWAVFTFVLHGPLIGVRPLG
jgi:uncharacterized membrane protein